MRKLFYILGALFFALIGIASYNLYQENHLDQEDYINVGAASDLRFAFEELGALFTEETGIKVAFQFGSSGNISQQIAHGAPIDMFASANKHIVEELIAEGHLIEDTKAIYGSGRIVLAVNKESSIEIENDNITDILIKTEKLAIANPNHAPYGLAAKEALENLGLWNQLEGKLVYGENVSQTMQFVQSGNVPVGIIALSIAKVPEIEYTIIDDMLHYPLEQTMAVVQNSPKKEWAKSFANFVNGQKGRIVMEKYGFTIPEERD